MPRQPNSRQMLLATVVLLAAAASASPPTLVREWEDPTQPVAVRAKLLLAKMNREEKIAMTFATHTGSGVVNQFNKTGVGAAKFMSAFSCAPGDIKSCVTQRNEMQQLFKEESRLGIPVSFINEGLHGGAPGGTIFPEPIGQGMSWNVSLVGKIAAAIAAEASAIGVDAVRRQS
jgi:beta-glucosidase